MKRIKHSKYKYKTVSLFAGIGGFDIAFSNAGFAFLIPSRVESAPDNLKDNSIESTSW